MAITDAKIQLPLPVGTTGIRKKDGTTPTIRYVPVGENLLANGTFETDTSGWGSGSGAALSRDTTRAKVGSASLRVTKTGAGTEKAMSDLVPCTPGSRWAGHAWGYNVNATSIRINLGFYDANDVFVSAVNIGPISTTGAWFLHSVSGDAPPSATQVRVYFDVEGAAGQIVNVDAVVLQPCVPLVESPYTEPSATGESEGGILSYDVDGEAAFLGDVQVFDMGAQTDGALAVSNYTRVFRARHVFTGDVLVDNGIFRLWLKVGFTSTKIRASMLVDGAWSAFEAVGIDIAGNAPNAGVQSIRLSEVSRGRVVAHLTMQDGNRAVLTVKRGIPAFRVDTTRVANSGGYQDMQYDRPSRFVIYNASSIIKDHTLTASSTSVAGSGLTEPYAIGLDTAYAFIPGIVFTKKPTTLYHGASGETPLWRDNAATTSAFERTFWVMLLPWPWMTNGYLFKEAESTSTDGLGASVVADALASGGNALRFDANGEVLRHRFVAGRDLPLGDYTAIYRVKDSANVASDYRRQVRNETDAVDLASVTLTLTSTYAYYSVDFTLDADDNNDTIFVGANKTTATPNNIDTDCILIIPRKRNSSTPAHIFFPRDIARNLLMVTSQLDTVQEA